MEEKEEIKNEGWSYKKILLEIWGWIYCIGLALIAVLLIKNFLFSMTTVRQTSMYPTIKEWDMLIINRLNQVRGVPLKRGEVVVFEAPDGAGGDNIAYYADESSWNALKFFSTLYVKRVIAIAGDQVTIEDGVLYINGERQDEEYVNPENSNNRKDLSLVVPEGYVFCMGDNRGSSKDCRNFGVIPLEKVVGTANFRILPLNKIGNVD